MPGGHSAPGILFDRLGDMDCGPNEVQLLLRFEPSLNVPTGHDPRFEKVTENNRGLQNYMHRKPPSVEPTPRRAGSRLTQYAGSSSSVVLECIRWALALQEVGNGARGHTERPI